MTDTATLGSPLTAVRNIPIIIRANDDNNQQAGSKTINVANYDGNLLNAVIGTAYCPDNDDLWDIANKQFTKIDGDASLALVLLFNFTINWLSFPVGTIYRSLV